MSKSWPPGSLAHFAQLFLRLDQSQGVRERQQALLVFLNHDRLADKDAAWALWLLAGERLKRTVAPSLFRKAMEEATGLQPWLSRSKMATKRRDNSSATPARFMIWPEPVGHSTWNESP